MVAFVMDSSTQSLIFAVSQIHLRPDLHYTPVGHHWMQKTSHSGLVYRPMVMNTKITYLSRRQVNQYIIQVTIS